MVTNQQFRKLALSFPEAVELPHFENTSFRVGKKIFITLNEKEKKACAKFTLEEQDLFSLHDKTMIYPVPNKWGKQGWTFIELKKVNTQILREAITTAYCIVAPKRLATQARERDQK